MDLDRDAQERAHTHDVPSPPRRVAETANAIDASSSIMRTRDATQFRRRNRGSGQRVSSHQGFRNSDIGRNDWIRSQTILTLASTGTATNAPMTPHIQPSSMIIIKTATGLSVKRRPTTNGTTPCQQIVISTK